MFFHGTGRLAKHPAQASPQRHANGPEITPNIDTREALERSELVQQNGCRQRLEGYLSYQQRLALAVA